MGAANDPRLKDYVQRIATPNTNRTEYNNSDIQVSHPSDRRIESENNILSTGLAGRTDIRQVQKSTRPGWAEDREDEIRVRNLQRKHSRDKFIRERPKRSNF